MWNSPSTLIFFRGLEQECKMIAAHFIVSLSLRVQKSRQKSSHIYSGRRLTEVGVIAPPFAIFCTIGFIILITVRLTKLLGHGILQ